MMNNVLHPRCCNNHSRYYRLRCDILQRTARNNIISELSQRLLAVYKLFVHDHLGVHRRDHSDFLSNILPRILLRLCPGGLLDAGAFIMFNTQSVQLFCTNAFNMTLFLNIYVTLTSHYVTLRHTEKFLPGLILHKDILTPISYMRASAAIL